MTSKVPSITPQLVVQAVAFVVTQVVAFGLLDAGAAQTIVAVGGIVIPAAFAVAQALHLGRVHAAIVQAPAVTGVPAVPVVPVRKVTP